MNGKTIKKAGKNGEKQGSAAISRSPRRFATICTQISNHIASQRL
jgi:hypothetical protein